MEPALQIISDLAWPLALISGATILLWETSGLRQLLWNLRWKFFMHRIRRNQLRQKEIP